jgi:hypothetical protein
MSQTDELLSWAKVHRGHLHDQVEIYEDPQYGVALRVRASKSPNKTGLPAESKIVSCPFQLSLSYLNALDVLPEFKSHSDHFPEELLSSTLPHVIGNIFLIQQYLNENSFWGPYIKSLPQPHEHEKLGTPLYFTANDMKWLQGTDLELARNQREQAWRSEFEAAVKAMSDSSEKWAEWSKKWTWDLYRWVSRFILALLDNHGYYPLMSAVL